MILHICVYDSASVQDLFYGMGMFLPEGARIIMHNNNIIYIIYIYIHPGGSRQKKYDTFCYIPIFADDSIVSRSG